MLMLLEFKKEVLLNVHIKSRLNVLIAYQDQLLSVIVIEFSVIIKVKTKRNGFQSDFVAQVTILIKVLLYHKGNSLHFFHADLVIPCFCIVVHSFLHYAKDNFPLSKLFINVNKFVIS